MFRASALRAGVLVLLVASGCRKESAPPKSSADGVSAQAEERSGTDAGAEPTVVAKAQVAAPVIEAPDEAPSAASVVAAPRRAPASAKPAEMLTFERAIAPFRTMSAGNARGAEACKKRKSLYIGDDIPREVPHPNIDEDAWRKAMDHVGVGVSELGACCQENLGGVDPECAESMLVSTLEGLDELQAFFEDSP